MNIHQVAAIQVKRKCQAALRLGRKAERQQILAFGVKCLYLNTGNEQGAPTDIFSCIKHTFMAVYKNRDRIEQMIWQEDYHHPRRTDFMLLARKYALLLGKYLYSKDFLHWIYL